MISKCIEINWDNSKEYIEIDVDNLSSIKSICSSREYLKEDGTCYPYIIKSNIKKITDGIEIIICYKHENNPQYEKNEIYWGETHLKIQHSQSSGIATWKDYDDDTRNDEVEWKSIENILIREKCKKTVQQNQRDQSKLRKKLLALDKCCVITGEKTPEVLEAAHIIPVKNGGQEIVKNAILLRSDIHRLFDAGKFTLSAKGKITKLNGISHEYESFLKNYCIKENIVERVKDALIYKVKYHA